MMRLVLKICLGLLLLPILLVALVLLMANTDPGRRLIAREAGALAGGQVVLRGLSGRFPDSLRLEHAELHDSKGAWLTLDGVVLDWSPLALFGRDASIRLLSAEHIDVRRRPAPSPPGPPAKPSSGGFSLPVRVDLAALRVARLDIGSPVAGAAATVRIDGSFSFVSLTQASLAIAIDRLDRPGDYQLNATVAGSSIAARLIASEPEGGLAGRLANLPALGALGVNATIAGPRSAERTDIRITAGALHAAASGTVDLVGQSAALDVNATAPAMAPRPDLAWGGITLAAHVHGPFKTPEIAAHAVITDFKGGGASLQTVTADASGNRGIADLHTIMTGLLIPSARPELFASAPLDFTLHADLDKPGIPVRFALKHPLVSADGSAITSGDISAKIHTVVPDLAPLAALGDVKLQGHTEATAAMSTHGNDTDITLDGTADFTGGQTPVPTLLGKTSFGVTARLAGQDISISRATVDGAQAHASVTGTDTGKALALAWKLVLPDLRAASAQLKGALTATGRVDGPQTGIALTADIDGRLGTASVPEGPIAVHVKAQDLPSKPSGTLQATGRFAGAPLVLTAQLERQDDGGFQAVLKHAAWQSFAADATLVLPKDATVPVGTVSAHMARLADLAPILGRKIGGSFQANIETTASNARITLLANDISAAGAALGRISLTGNVRDPASKTPGFALALQADGIDAYGVTGTAHLAADGKRDALRLRATGGAQISGAPAALDTLALLDLAKSQVSLESFAATYKGEALRLSAPARLGFGAEMGVDRLRLALGDATLDVAGKISPALNITASLRGVTPALLKPFDPKLSAAGLLTADARLTGTTAALRGNVRVQASGLRLRTGPAASLPAGNLLAMIGLNGDTAHIDARASAGPKLHFAATGTAPVKSGALIALHATGGLDISLLNPVLNAGGRRAAGNVSMNADIGGTTAAPRIDGAVTLAGGEIQDFAQGVLLTDISARLTESGDTLAVEKFSAKAGPGTLSLSGTVGVLAAALPVDLHFTAHHAQPLSSDLLTANLDADLSVQGQAAGQMKAAGRIFVRRAEINIPNALPPSVAVLNVRMPGYKPPPPAPPGPTSEVALAIVLDAPSNIFVRGHGLDAELGGKLAIGGKAASPQIAGGFEMRRGDIGVAGTTLTFSKGEVSFDGTSVTGKIDPTLNFVADSTSGGVTATLAVGGYADAPKLTLSSVPDLPQDEVLAHLLFGESVKDLSAIQIAEIASAIAELSGVTGGGGDPLGAVRKGLGLDRLSVGGGSGSSGGATVEAGRYVARGVYVGAKQATSGGGTAAVVQVDLTKRLKATAQLATGGGSVQGATPDNDPGSTIGLSYGFDY